MIRRTARRGRSACGGGAVSTEAVIIEASRAGWEELAVEHLQLPPRVNEGLRKRGISTVGQALKFSESSIAFQFAYAPELLQCARQIRACARADAIDWPKYWQLRENRFHQLAATLPEFDQLAEALSPYAVDRRSLGNAGAMLQASGVRTFPDLIAALRDGMEPVRGIGRTKIAELFGSLFELSERLQEGRLPKLNPIYFAGSSAREDRDVASPPPEAAVQPK